MEQARITEERSHAESAIKRRFVDWSLALDAVRQAGNQMRPESSRSPLPIDRAGNGPEQTLWAVCPTRRIQTARTMVGTAQQANEREE